MGKSKFAWEINLSIVPSYVFRQFMQNCLHTLQKVISDISGKSDGADITEFWNKISTKFDY